MDYAPPEDEAHPDVGNEYFAHVALSSVKGEHKDEQCDLKTLIDIKHELIWVIWCEGLSFVNKSIKKTKT